MFKRKKPLKRTALKLSEEEILAIKKVVKGTGISENHYKRESIRLQLKKDNAI